jgi:hypothetical protein
VLRPDVRSNRVLPAASVAIAGSLPRNKDDLRLGCETLAPSKAAPVARVAERCAEYARRPAVAAEARRLPSLPAVHTVLRSAMRRARSVFTG